MTLAAPPQITEVRDSLHMNDPVDLSGAQSSDDDNSTEEKHFTDVCESFASYSIDCASEIARIERHFQALSSDDKELLIETIPSRIQKMRAAVQKNQEFLDTVLADYKAGDVEDELNSSEPNMQQSGLNPVRNESTHDSSKQENKSSLLVEAEKLFSKNKDHDGSHGPSKFCRQLYTRSTRSRNASKVRSTLRQFVRDWSEEGEAERSMAYGPLLADLEEYLNLKEFELQHGRCPRVLCPGSGLGRLPFEIVKRGYGCQGNEFSYYMLLGSNLVLNSNLALNSCKIYPYCLSTSNRFGNEDHLKEVCIPDIRPGDYLIPGGDFSMCAGEFVEVYWSQEAEWDAVLTCFFIDTAKNVLQYIRTIARILKPGGVWANLGPLLYHFAEMASEMSIELSWEEIKIVIKKYFDIKHESCLDAYYTSNSQSLMQVQYHCIHFVAIRNNEMIMGHSIPVY